jgi:hypothetical protein
VCLLSALSVLPCCAGGHVPLVRQLPPPRPRLERGRPLSAPPIGAGIPALLDGLVACLPPLHPKARNTVILALLWTIWKSRNRMVFDFNDLSTHRILALLVDHLRLWTARASSQVNTDAMLTWCAGLA